MVSEREKQELKVILVNIFGERARDWEVNEDSVRILSEMLEKGRRCSRSIDKLPRVSGWVPGAAYVPTQIIGYLYREVCHSKNSILQMCQTVQLSPYATAFEMASMGLPVHFPVCY
jgi:hypothetical protein